MEVPEDLLYTREHQWIKIKQEEATIGITDYAQNSLGDIMYVELPLKGKKVAQFEKVVVIESVKVASEVLSPLSGEIVEVNSFLKKKPELINQSPYKEGWLLVLKIASMEEKETLISAEEYRDYLKTLEK